MLRQRGIKRFTHQLFALSGTLSFKHGKLVRIVLKAGYPMIDHNSGDVLVLAYTLGSREDKVFLGLKRL